MIKRIIHKLFYDPYRFVKKYPNIVFGESSILLKSCTFRFDIDSAKNSVTIGSNSMIGCNFIFESDQGMISVGDNTFINSGTNLISRSEIVIGNNVTIAWGCTIYDHNSHALSHLERRNDFLLQFIAYKQNQPFSYKKNWDSVKSQKIVIENDVWIGFDSLILNGVTIGEGAVIGAKSVVRNDVEPWTVVAGNPAVVIKRLK